MNALLLGRNSSTHSAEAQHAPSLPVSERQRLKTWDSRAKSTLYLNSIELLHLLPLAPGDIHPAVPDIAASATYTFETAQLVYARTHALAALVSRPRRHHAVAAVLTA